MTFEHSQSNITIVRSPDERNVLLMFVQGMYLPADRNTLIWALRLNRKKRGSENENNELKGHKILIL